MEVLQSPPTPDKTSARRVLGVKLPWQTLGLFGAAILGIAIGGFYTLRGNPEIRFFRRDHQLKMEWARQLQRVEQAKFVFVGGSGMGTTLNARRMLEQHQLCVLNLALAAGMGA